MTGPRNIPLAIARIAKVSRAGEYSAIWMSTWGDSTRMRKDLAA